MKKYKFKGNLKINEHAQVVGEYLETNFPNNKIKPGDVVRLAKDKKSPLHRFFDWDDKSAAEKYRVWQARVLISSLYVELDDGANIRAYENLYIEELDSNSYLPTSDIKDVPDLSQQVLAQALKELTYWKMKYQSYSDYFGVILSAIDEVGRSIKGVQDEEESGRNTGSNTPNRIEAR